MISSVHTKLDVSLIALILANLTPIYGVLFGEWTILQVFILFWAETAVIGFYNIVKITFSAGKIAFILVPFFIFHFSGFMLVHLLFILAMFSESNTFSESLTLLTQTIPFMAIPILFYVTSHGISFVTNFISKKEYKVNNPAVFLFAPYGRIAIMHITLMIGGIVVLFLGAPTFGLLFLIGIKIIIDSIAHRFAHTTFLSRSAIPKQRPRF
jgi:hypothetical protein